APAPVISLSSFSENSSFVKHPPCSRDRTVITAYGAVAREFAMNLMTRLLAAREDRGNFSTLDMLRWPRAAFASRAAVLASRAAVLDVSFPASLCHPGVPANHASQRSQVVRPAAAAAHLQATDAAGADQWPGRAAGKLVRQQNPLFASFRRQDSRDPRLRRRCPARAH